MKALMRKFSRLVSNLTKRWACDTFGDTASLHAGPCERCVGFAVVGADVSGEPSPDRMATNGPGLYPSP